MLLQDELRAYPGYLLARARAQAFRAFDNAVGAPFELRPVEFSVLVLLKSNAQASPAQLAASLHVAAPNLTGILRRLEDRGLVRRFPCPEDRRATNATITEAGLQLIADAAPGHVDTVRETVLDALTPEQLEQLYAIAGAVLARLDPDERLAATSCQFSEGPALARAG